MDQPSLYDEDIVTWAEQQAAAVRELARRPELSNILDWENVAEEIESVGRCHLRAVEGLLRQTMVHLLKRLSAPSSPALRHWRGEILTFQASAEGHFGWAMRQRIDLDKLWRKALEVAEAELTAYGEELLPNLPQQCPLRLEDLVGGKFDADAALQRIAASLTRS